VVSVGRTIVAAQANNVRHDRPLYAGVLSHLFDFGRISGEVRHPILTMFGVIALAAAAGALAVRYVPVDHHLVLMLAAASPYLMIAAPVSVLLLALSRRWLVTAIAGCLTVAMLVVQLPRYLGPETGVAASVSVRVMTANLRLGLADAKALTDSARELADVLVVQELTPEAVSRLSAAGLDHTFPHRALNPHNVASGVGVWSRWPIVQNTPILGYEMPLLRTRIRIDGVVVDPTVVSVHLSGPWPQPIDDWRSDLAKFPATLEQLAKDAGAGAVIVAGDFNSTTDMRPFRHLLGDGYRDAAEQAGAGMARSYPNRRWAPPLLGIDHILVYNGAATSARTVSIPGSDHRGLVATIDVPHDSTAS
jgi:endonuclease/exonuclease/phosphatase (EEP) superfamily protein YafD